MSKVWNFSAGPAMLPAEVMEVARAEFTDYRGLGYGIIEASHRSKEYEEVNTAAQANIRDLLGLSDDFAVIFVQGGASQQFSLVPMNFLQGSADYVDTGSWSAKAIKEAKKVGQVRLAAGSQDTGYDRIPDPAVWDCDPHASYLHLTSNNTIAGTQFATFPTPPEGVPLMADMSSDILSRPFDAAPFGCFYAGAQKNLGPAGVTLVVVRRDLLAREPEGLGTMLRYSTHVGKDSLYNTPPTFGVYLLRLVTDWLRRLGGLEAVARRNREKSDLLYNEIDRDAFYRSPVQRDSRSLMNVVFRLTDEAREADFLAAATAAGLVGLKGHRSVGGMRASIYNAMPLAGVQALVDFMQDFRRRA